MVSQVKLIAEPWDVGEGGYQVGNFPPLWSEWNGKYRDAVRDFWRGSRRTLPEFASRLTGSSDLYETSGRPPVASVNFVTCHDGFTLTDLVSYNDKHNEANGEGNPTAATTTGPGTAASRARRPTRRSTSYAGGSGATSWSRCSARRACRCCWPATSSAAPSRATTTRTARTTRSPGWTGKHASQEKDLQEFTRRPGRVPAAPPACSAAAGSSSSPTAGPGGRRETSPG